MKNDKILLAHGAGGRLTEELIRSVFLPKFGNSRLKVLEDAAELKKDEFKNKKIIFSTDSFVVTPVFFAGGDIGKLAVCGTVNDIAMRGGKPLALAIACIIEEGFEVSELKQIASSAAFWAKKAGVEIVAGDTKVVEKGKADKIFLTSSGIGAASPHTDISAANARPGDLVIINGSIGEHGLSVITARNDFKLSPAVKSDCAPLNNLVSKMLKIGKSLHTLRDPTRGGLATALNEIASSSEVSITLDEQQIPVTRQVRSACGLLGFDPLYLANEGKLIAFVRESSAAKLLSIMRGDPYGRDSRIIGRVTASPAGVWIKTRSGGARPVRMLEGEQLPRIC
jgi:hydrogenase expression/formation protein HypE